MSQDYLRTGWKNKGEHRKMPTLKESDQNRRTLSLHPLKFEEAITDILKIKPEPKPSQKSRAKKRTSKGRPTGR